jgi:hypothetical protein
VRAPIKSSLLSNKELQKCFNGRGKPIKSSFETIGLCELTIHSTEVVLKHFFVNSKELALVSNLFRPH